MKLFHLHFHIKIFLKRKLTLRVIFLSSSAATVHSHITQPGYEVFYSCASQEKPDNIHVGSNTAPSPQPQFMWNVSRNIRSKKLHFEIFTISENYQYYVTSTSTTSPVLCVDKANANDINKDFTVLIKKEFNLDYISHENIKQSYINVCSVNILIGPVLQFKLRI